MTYSVEFAGTAEKQFRRLPDEIAKRITTRILALKENPRPHDVKKLVGVSAWRIRIGDYRVVYEIDDQRNLLTVVAIKPRQSAYR